MPRIRLLKVSVTAVFVVDDGETLVEQPQPAVELSASAWPEYPAALEAKRVESEAQLNAEER